MPAEPIDPLTAFRRHLAVERGLSANTCKSYCYQIGQYLAFLSRRNTTVSAANREDIVAWLEEKKNAGQRSASLFGATMALRQFHRFLAAAGRTASDPTAGMKLPRIKSRRPEILSEEETTQLLSFPAAKFVDIRDQALLELLYSGLRISEALAIGLQDIHAEEGYVRVASGKGGRERLVPIGTKAIEALDRYIEAQSHRFPGNLACLFVSYRRKPLTRTAFWLRLKNAATRVGIRKTVYPHILRHGFATAMMNHGCDLKSLQEILGHKSLSTTTSIYLHPTAAQLIQAHRLAHPRA